MDTTELQVFLAIARARSLTTAAEHLHLAQSTVSYRLRTLEALVGARLVDRKRGKAEVTLTHEGEDFLTIAQRWEELGEEFHAFRSRTVSYLRLGAPDSINSYVLPPVYARLSTQSQELSLTIETANSPELYEKLSRRELDVAFVLYKRRIPNLVAQPILTEPMVVVSGGRLKAPRGRGAVNVQELDPAEELYIDWGHEYQVWRQSCLAMGEYAIQLRAAPLVIGFMEDRHKWAIVPLSMANALRALGWNRYPIHKPPPQRITFCAYLGNRSRRVELGIRRLERCLDLAGDDMEVLAWDGGSR